MIDLKIFAIKMAELDEIIGTPLSDTANKTYFRVLNDRLSTDEFIKAIDELISEWNYSYYPKPAHIIEKSKEFDEIDLEIIAKKASKVFAEAIESVGRYTIPEFEDKIIPQVIEMLGGWVECCNIPSYDKLSWLKRDFENVYKQVAEKGITKEVKLLAATDNPVTKKISCDYKTPKIKVANNLLPANSTLNTQLKLSYKTF